MPYYITILYFVIYAELAAINNMNISFAVGITNIQALYIQRFRLLFGSLFCYNCYKYSFLF